ncbi:MAG TPA: SDR family NAD(P)-dependent oxidoreductase, partial [Candidatus Binatia bacterium]|nr:SDR family NAD(P)-dependent oxidoreductase [Candidatus Binatia bacterium]
MYPKAALVIGGSSGMGKAMARVLVQEGYALTVCGRDRARLDGAVAELRGEAADGDPAVQGMTADVAGEQAIVDLIDAHRQAYGRLDVLVNSAGGGGGAGGGPIGALTPEAWDRTVALNLRSAFLAVHHSLELLRAAGAEHGKALVVNVGSAAGKEGTPGMSPYSAA